MGDTGCFNRTFMELKDDSLIDGLAILRFQSHLYGIERLVALHLSFLLLVSIAPLWN